MQLDVVADRLIDEIAAGSVLRGGKRIERVNLFGVSTEADGFFRVGHNAITIPRIIM